MKVTTKYADTMTSGCQADLATAGVLGEVYSTWIAAAARAVR